MKSLQSDFLKQSVVALQELAKCAESQAVLSPEFVREAFRTLHTIKGTLQTFGFSASSKIAHELENLLSDAKENDESLTVNFKNNLLEGLAYLINSFTDSDNLKDQNPFLKKSNEAEKKDLVLPETFTFESDFFSKFSLYEKKTIVSEVNKGRNIFLVYADFDLSNFTDEFKKLRENLSAKGEIIATLSNVNIAAKGKIGFQICLATDETSENLEEITSDFSTEIFEQKPLLQNNLDKVLSQITAHGKELAEKVGKKIEFEINARNIELSPDKMKLIFEILLHLIRNAIDHAIGTKAERIAKGKKRKAKITISLEAKKNGLKLSVKDDGKGIDTEKIRAKAIEKKMISPDKTLTESEMLDLIFLHELSTAETLTEISGRGVGLDAVKNLVENAGGIISVKSQRDFGTTFEVLLRYKK